MAYLFISRYYFIFPKFNYHRAQSTPDISTLRIAVPSSPLSVHVCDNVRVNVYGQFLFLLNLRAGDYFENIINFYSTPLPVSIEATGPAEVP